MADNRSTCSTTSISKSNQKVECPFCKEEFQNRYIFNHIQKKHIREFVDHIFLDTVEDLQLHIDNAWAVPLFWKVRNDFDEMEDSEIYGCLACGTGVPSKSNAATHCAKDKCRAKHIAELKRLMPMIKRKEKAAQEDKDAKNPKNWSEEQLIKHITISMRRYKWQSIRAQSLAHSYNEYVRHAPDRFTPAKLDLEPLVMRKDDLIAENMRWILINSGLDLEIVRMRDVLWNSTSFDYDAWLPRSSLHPDSNFIPFMCMHHAQFQALYPEL